MRVSKIKIDSINGDKTAVWYYKEDGSTYVETKVSDNKPRLPEFSRAMCETIPLINRVFDLPKNWSEYEDMHLREISFTHSDSGILAHATLVKKFKGRSGALIIKTPTIPELATFQRLQELAADFVRGKRAQRDMFETKHIKVNIEHQEELIDAAAINA